ncbi:hypothetical protein Tco_0717367 [Tanacetum coccineum]
MISARTGRDLLRDNPLVSTEVLRLGWRFPVAVNVKLITDDAQNTDLTLVMKLLKTVEAVSQVKKERASDSTEMLQTGHKIESTSKPREDNLTNWEPIAAT